MMKISKSSRHAKITGDFGESVILYWLSKYGFECALVDHTGVDVLAKNPHTGELMGISVKSRCRTKGSERDSISFPDGNFRKVEDACEAFGCKPYVAFVADVGSEIRAYLTSVPHLLELHPRTRSGSEWKMRDTHLAAYDQDPEVKSFIFRAETTCWWKD